MSDTKNNTLVVYSYTRLKAYLPTRIIINTRSYK